MEKETVRIEGFSDAVFAIAITLLVLELRAPEANIVKNGTQLLDFLQGEWTTYLAFTLSFFSIFIMWVNHHKIFKQIYSRNTGIMFSNGLILFLVSAVSYPTALLARFFNSEASNIAVAIYTGIFVLINISYNLLWYNASSDKKLLRPGITDSAIKKIRNNYLYGFPTYLIAFGVSFQFPSVALAINMLLLIFWAFSSGKIKVIQE
ncbi:MULTISPECIES: TMEM175 family protein [unclassified Flavobacterium]|uniref:TMEM175 family protein n=1 Tax=unclassified Flavobacterium TaxID=196869 RepID=UPI001065E05C|nr:MULTISPECIES: TMEM175 family protein [unclassified Flavobacterium]TDX10439.1 putative membrane protein [Flavobacterium sp. S87F.05.LMB.W.Kidney.N]BDU26217.1 membrane protein [Flavobacterium sp. GSB-24]